MPRPRSTTPCVSRIVRGSDMRSCSARLRNPETGNGVAGEGKTGGESPDLGESRSCSKRSERYSAATGKGVRRSAGPLDRAATRRHDQAMTRLESVILKPAAAPATKASSAQNRPICW